MDFLTSLFHWAIFLAIVAAIVLWISYNRLQRAAQNVKEKSSNVQIALSKKLSLINQLITVVKNYGEYEQFTHIKISGDTGAAGMAAAYEESNTTLLAIQAAAQRFPDLKADTQYGRLIDSIQGCEDNIQAYRVVYNDAAKNYNSICLSIPTVFYSRALGFPSAPYLEFDTSGVPQENSLREFKTDDGERLNQLLGRAGGALAQAGKNLLAQAGQIGMGTSEDESTALKAVSYCSKCGDTPGANAVFCGNCGNRIRG
jgi:LemA protein